MIRHVLTDAALGDLADIYLYIARDNPRAAARQIDKFTARFIDIELFPYSGRKRDEIGEGLYSYPIGNYVAFYAINDDELLILRVLHGALDIQNISFGRKRNVEE